MFDNDPELLCALRLVFLVDAGSSTQPMNGVVIIFGLEGAVRDLGLPGKGVRL